MLNKYKTGLTPGFFVTLLKDTLSKVGLVGVTRHLTYLAISYFP